MSQRVLHILGGREDTGGIFSVLRNLQEAEEGGTWRHEVWVSQEFRETRTPKLHYQYSQSTAEDSFNHFKILLQAARELPKLNRLIAENKYDIVHGHTRVALPLCIALSKRSEIPIVYTNHNYARRTALYRLATRINRLHWIFLTPNMANHYDVIPTHPNISIVSACFSNRFLNQPLISKREARSRLQLVGVGNIVRWKNWHLLIQAVASLPREFQERLQVSIWGPNSTEPDARAYASELNSMVSHHNLKDTIRLEGPTQDVEGKIQEADFFVLPSTNEPCSVALMEALALGTPALVSRSGGNIDIIREGDTGIFFEPGDFKSLAETLKKLTVEEEAKFQSKVQIRDSVRTRSASVVWDAYKSIYEKLLTKPT